MNTTQKTNKKDFCNQAEPHTREARWLLFYDKNQLTFNDALKGKYPNPEDYLFQVRVNDIPAFKRDIKNREQDHNRFTSVNIELDYFPMKSSDIAELRKLEKRNSYIVVLATNADLQLFGNHREPMSFRVDDNIRDNGSGSDTYKLIVEGNTTIRPVAASLPEEVKKSFFRVLLYGNPIV